ncbi:DUF4386 domain-containing protein [Patiriisocius sp. Uisw_017]|jgi:hypothetical protein|uniref:DUF4386 domain-containing protein n=1 Tax=Patiriisocius sp. Uisw_017 TaxID=3230968 RepID=UPI0039E8BEEC
MTPIKKSRLAGITYLTTVLTVLFSLMYVPNKQIELDNIATTVLNIRDHRGLFASGVISELLCYIALLILPLVLYPSLKKHNLSLAKIMVSLVLVAAPISCLTVVYKINILSFLNDPNMKADQIQTLTSISFKSYHNTTRVASIFWGLCLIPFGYLGYTSGHIPKVLAVFLIIGGLGYQINFIGYLLMPEFNQTIIPRIAKIPSSIGEIGTCLWLLIVGMKKEGKYV